MTTLSAEVAEAVDGYDQTVTKQLLSTQQNYRWRNRAESEVVANMLADQLSVADKAIERLHARVRELEKALAATRMDIRWHTCEESSECLACDEDALIEKPHHED